jgi:hypothetical protein
MVARSAQVAALKEDAAEKQRQVAALAQTEPSDLWRDDLAGFLVALEAEEAGEAARGAELLKQQKQSRGGAKVTARPTALKH